jgi:hypothetical protein
MAGPSATHNRGDYNPTLTETSSNGTEGNEGNEEDLSKRRLLSFVFFVSFCSTALTIPETTR